jgi:hypothetical protein
VRASSTARRFPTWIVAATVVLAWLGLVIHNIVEFPLMAFTRAEYSVPSLVWLILFLAWRWFPNHHSLPRLLLGWGAISLAGAILTVIPLPFWPFRPEQTLRHYGVHALYAVTQLPVLWLTWRMRDSECEEHGPSNPDRPRLERK